MVNSALVLFMSVSVIIGMLVWLVFPFDSGHDELALMLEAIHK